MKFTQEDRKDLVWSMRKTLLDHVRSNKGLTESKRISAENFIVNEATYEQLLNLVYNPQRDTKYQSASVLEGVALESYKTFISEASKIALEAKRTAKNKIVKESEEAAEEKKEEEKKEEEKVEEPAQENVLESIFLEAEVVIPSSDAAPMTSAQRGIPTVPAKKTVGQKLRGAGSEVGKFVTSTGGQLTNKAGEKGLARAKTFSKGAGKVAIPVAALTAGAYMMKRHSDKKKAAAAPVA